MTEQSWLTPGPECLTPAQLERLAEGQGEPQAQAHLNGCAVCKAELALLREFNEAAPLADEAAAVRAITVQLERKPWQNKQASVWERWRSWTPLAAAALAAMLVMVVWIGRPQTAPISSDTDTMRSGRVTLLAPLGEMTSWPAQFTWSPVSGAARYAVRLVEVDGTVIWTGESGTPALSIPANLVQPGRAVDWTVTAYDAAGQRITESERQRIRLQPAKP